MTKSLIAATVIASLWAGGALAQQNAPMVQLADPNASIAVLGLTVDQTVGKELYDSEGNQIGVVARVLGDDGDTPMALVVNTDGRQVVLELAAMELINNRLVTQLSDEEFKGLPAWQQ